MRDKCDRHSTGSASALISVFLIIVQTQAMKELAQKIITVLFVIFAGAWGLSAQFTIQQTKENERLEIEPIQMQALSNISIEANYFDRAAWRAQKLRERKERNTIQFDASLQTSMQRYEKWSASTDNNFSMLASVFFRHQYKRDKFNLDYKFEAYYGMNMVSDDEAVERKDNFFKNKDEFKFNLNMGWTMKKNWSYSATANFRSQFTKGYPKRKDYTLTSNFLAPGYFDVAVGFTYKDPKKPFKVILSPLSGSVTMVLDKNIWPEVAKDKPKPSKYGVAYKEKFAGHIGPSGQVDFDYQFGRKKNFRYRTTLYAFTSYSAPLDHPLVRWDNTFEMRVSRFISAKLYGQAYYKKEDKEWVQYQYSFTLGLAYHFKNK